MTLFNLDAAKLVAGQKFGRALLLGKKYSPEVLTVVGVAGVITAAVMIARATLKLEPVLDKHEEEIDAAKELKKLGEYSEEQYKIDLTRIYTKRAVDVFKLYVPGGLVLGTSLACLVGASWTLKKRNVAAVAAYNVIKSQYDNYRQNVIDDQGADKDRDYRLGLREETVIDFETGEERVIKKSDPNRYSKYAKIFDESNVNFNKHWREGNLTFLLGQQKFATERLHSKGWLVLNDVYDALGLPETPDGAVTGWVLGAGGDDYVDFGIFDLESPAARDFVNGYEPHVILDFNIDGFIQDFIGIGQRQTSFEGITKGDS
jgi:hypothetical protein